MNTIKITKKKDEDKLCENDDNSRNINNILSSIFLMIGIPANIMGYQFLKDAIKLTINQPNIINSVTKVLYPTVAEHFKTTPSRVERSIRHAIEISWCRNKIINLNTVFGLNLVSGNEKPTNSEFIALISDRLLQECA